MKKKNKMLMIGAVLIALCIFTVTAVASTTNFAGYETFKEILKANHMAEDTIQSGTANGGFTVKADGETILELDGTVKAGETGQISSDFNLAFLGTERSGSIYGSEQDKIYFVDRTHDLHYQVINLDSEDADNSFDRFGEYDFQHQAMTKEEEALLDFIVGDLKRNFVVDNHTDGSKTIIFDVSEEEVPLPLRLLVDVASTADKHNQTYTDEWPEELERLKQIPFFQGLHAADFENHLPQLTEDVVIENIRFQMTVNENNVLQGMEGKLQLSGKDEKGHTHLVVIEGAGTFSDLNATTPDVYDPADRSIEMIDANDFN